MSTRAHRRGSIRFWAVGCLGAVVLVCLTAAIIARIVLYWGPDPADRDFEAEHRIALLALWGLDREPDENGWDALIAATDALQTSELEMLETDALVPALAVDAWSQGGQVSAEARARFAELEALAAANGVYDAMDRLAAAPIVIGPYSGDPLRTSFMTTRSESRALARFLHALHNRALDAGDIDTALLSIRRLLTLARAQRFDGSVISYLVEAAIAALTADAVHTLLTSAELSELQLAELLAALNAYNPPPIAAVMTCEKIITLNALWEDTAPGIAPKPVSRGVQIERAEALHDLVIEAADADGPDRAALLAQLPDPDSSGWSTMLADLSVGAPDRTLEIADWCRAQLAAARLHAAIELHHAQRGTYPETLDALAPTYFNTLPADPRGPDNTRYRLADPTSHQGRGFLLSLINQEGDEQILNPPPREQPP